MAWKFEPVAGPCKGPTYGVAWDGGGVLFSASGESSILRYDPAAGVVTEFRRYMAGVKGLGFDREGNFYGCQASSRRIVRFNRDGSTAPMEHKLDGKFHNHPYALACDAQGRIWFSDPIDPAPTRGPQLFGPLPHQSVLRLEKRTDGRWQIKRMTYDTRCPGAILISRDQQTLYVAENGADKQELRAYPIQPDGSLGAFVVLHSFGSDYRGAHRGIGGMCEDAEGNIVACAGSNKSGPGPMIYIFARSGRVLETHPTPFDEPLMCAFGDAGLDALYVTSQGGHLYRARATARQGALLYPPR
ncbi:MAG TPA: SMP-30/gluconolactonase/LRE family protein [Candidatus Acidoferrales bacterium]|nr:SMP-30/gluconolactonase/LRE family protein [Candidatus Acidoferrales bacterium]